MKVRTPIRNFTVVTVNDERNDEGNVDILSGRILN